MRPVVLTQVTNACATVVVVVIAPVVVESVELCFFKKDIVSILFFWSGLLVLVSRFLGLMVSWCPVSQSLGPLVPCSPGLSDFLWSPGFLVLWLLAFLVSRFLAPLVS